MVEKQLKRVLFPRYKNSVTVPPTILQKKFEQLMT